MFVVSCLQNRYTQLRFSALTTQSIHVVIFSIFLWIVYWLCILWRCQGVVVATLHFDWTFNQIPDVD